MENFEAFYNKNYKKIMIIPLFLLVLSLIYVVGFYNSTGDLFKKDVTLSGGVTLSLYTSKPIDTNKLESSLKSQLPNSDIFIRELSEFGTEKQKGFIIEVSEVKGEELKNLVSKELNLDLTKENFSIEEMGSSLGAGFQRQMITAIFAAFVLMGIVVFFIYKTLIPSFAVILSAFSDIVFTIAVIDLLGMRIGTAGIAALLLLIGYSVDTDILMNTRVIKRKDTGGSVFDKLVSSAKTGLTMTFTTIAALIIGMLVVSGSFVFKEMFSILIIGLFADIIFTYLMNASIIKWYTELKKWQ